MKILNPNNLPLIDYRTVEPLQGSLKDLSDKNHDKLLRVLEKRGFTAPLFLWHNDGVYYLMDGHQRQRVMQENDLNDNGSYEVPYILIEAEDKASAMGQLLELTSQYGRITQEGFDTFTAEMPEVEYMDVNFDALPLVDFGGGGGGDGGGGGGAGSLAERFIVPPFSVLDSRQGYWQDRRRTWLDMGIKSEEGRGEALLGFSSLAAKFGNRGGSESNTSVFDPVLCEIIYTWFNTNNGFILDPFAGGSVRGVVAGKLNNPYTGIELRQEQVDANIEQGAEMLSEDYPQPVWLQGDSGKVLPTLKQKFDLVFSCPPYADLEVYSDDPDDLSNKPYPEFIKLYNNIIKEACNLLNDNRFAVFVVGEVRDKKGLYINFVADTIAAFEAAGLHYYNEMILVNAIGSLPLRVNRQFQAGRKIGKTHQNVLVFFKGDPKQIKTEYPEIELPEPTLPADEQEQE
jgi:DNA modification methylase